MPSWQEPKVEGEQSTLPGGQSVDNNDADAASPSDKLDSSKYETGTSSGPTFADFCPCCRFLVLLLPDYSQGWLALLVVVTCPSNFVCHMLQIFSIHSSDMPATCWAASLLRRPWLQSSLQKMSCIVSILYRSLLLLFMSLPAWFR